jgi:hypothetical protein
VSSVYRREKRTIFNYYLLASTVNGQLVITINICEHNIPSVHGREKQTEGQKEKRSVDISILSII